MSIDPFIRRSAAGTEHGAGVARLIRSVREHQQLIMELARRELTDLHAGQSGGFLWVIVHPLLMFAVYTFVFTVVLRVRIGINGPDDYTVYLFAGLAPWLLTQDVLLRSTGAMVVNVNIVKKVMFPVE